MAARFCSRSRPNIRIFLGSFRQDRLHGDRYRLDAPTESAGLSKGAGCFADSNRDRFHGSQLSESQSSSFQLGPAAEVLVCRSPDRA
jgi:hypothetical protein